MRRYCLSPVTGAAAPLEHEEWKAPSSDGSEMFVPGLGGWELGGTQSPIELSINPQPTPNQVANPTIDPRLVMKSPHHTDVSSIPGPSLRTSDSPISDCVYADQGDHDSSMRMLRSSASNNVWQNTTDFYHHPAQDCCDVGVGMEHQLSAFVPSYESMPVAVSTPKPLATITASSPNRLTEPVQRLLSKIIEHLAHPSLVESRLVQSSIYAHSTSIALCALRAAITGFPLKDLGGVEAFCLRRLASTSATLLRNFSSAERMEDSPIDTIKRLLILTDHMNAICHTLERNPNHLLSNIMSTGQVKFMARLLMNNPEVGSNELLAHFVCSLKEGTHSGLDDVAARLLYIGNSELPPNHLAAFAKAVVSASYTTLMSVRRLEYPESYFVSIIKNIFQALKGVGVGGQATVVMTSRNFDGAALADRTAGVRLGAGEKPTGTNSPDPTYFSSSSTSPELPPSQTMLTPHPPRTADVRLGPSEKPTSTNTPDPAYSSSSSASPELSPSQTKLTPNPLQTSQAPDILKCPDCDYIPGPGELGHRRSNLARHKRGHLGIMYQCPLCSREYTRTDNLRKHWINKHGENT